MRMQSKWRRISSVMGSHMNRFPGRGEGVCVTGGNTELLSLSYYGQGFLLFRKNSMMQEEKECTKKYQPI